MDLCTAQHQKFEQLSMESDHYHDRACCSRCMTVKSVISQQKKAAAACSFEALLSKLTASLLLAAGLQCVRVFTSTKYCVEQTPCRSIPVDEELKWLQKLLTLAQQGQNVCGEQAQLQCVCASLKLSCQSSAHWQTPGRTWHNGLIAKNTRLDCHFSALYQL